MSVCSPNACADVQLIASLNISSYYHRITSALWSQKRSLHPITCTKIRTRIAGEYVVRWAEKGDRRINIQDIEKSTYKGTNVQPMRANESPVPKMGKFMSDIVEVPMWQ